jgi:hypothetical protein
MTNTFATVVQTQTPINPGNSGGPLLTEDEKIVGVNSFRASEAEGLNFAIAANEIRFFLANPNNGMQAQNTCTEAKVLFEGRNDPSPFMPLLIRNAGVNLTERPLKDFRCA